MLTPVVATIWVMDGPATPVTDLSASIAASGREDVLPTGKAQLIVRLGGPNDGAVVAGPSVERQTIDTSTTGRLCGVALHPGGWEALSRVPARDLVGRVVPLTEVLEGGGRGELGGSVGIAEMMGRSAEWADAAAVADEIERWLGAVIRGRATAPEAAVTHAVSLLEAGVPVGEVATAVALDRRTLAGRFRAGVGIGLKRFSRLRRFERSVAAVRSPAAAPLVDLAIDLGYADQAHMTREFRELGGITPASLHRDGAPAPNHLDPGPDDATDAGD